MRELPKRWKRTAKKFNIEELEMKRLRGHLRISTCGGLASDRSCMKRLVSQMMRGNHPNFEIFASPIGSPLHRNPLRQREVLSSQVQRKETGQRSNLCLGQGPRTCEEMSEERIDGDGLAGHRRMGGKTVLTGPASSSSEANVSSPATQFPRWLFNAATKSLPHRAL